MNNPSQYAFIYRISPLWSDMDALGHINNAAYFTYFEQTRIAWLEQAGLLHYLNGRSDIGPVVVKTECTYKKAVVYPADLTISMSVRDIGRSSFTTEYEIRDGAGDICTIGSAVTVWVDYKAEKSIPLPEDVRGILPDLS
ncbi:MAG: thioesterase family protein [Spirochaetaceae bacterium]|nr:thioesterase family protein [Spirochaetaceae bacterium]MDT8299774.1 thioesterase family protein [Spirochaetaceae bacterium]